MKLLLVLVISIAVSFGSKLSRSSFNLHPKHLTEILAKRFTKSNFNFNDLCSTLDDDLKAVFNYELQEHGMSGVRDSKTNVLVSTSRQATSKSKVVDKVSNKTSEVNADEKASINLDLFGKCTSSEDFVGLLLNVTDKNNVKTEKASVEVSEDYRLKYFLKIQRIKAVDVQHELGFVAPDDVDGIYVIRATASAEVKDKVSTKDYEREYVEKAMGQALVVGVKSESDSCCKDTVKVFATGGAKASISTTVKGNKYGYTIGSVQSTVSVIKKHKHCSMPLFQ